MPDALIVTRNLSKDYGSFRALANLNLNVAAGEIVGLLGPNGSGKSTALRLLMGFLKPSEGSASIAGFDCWAEGVEARKRVTYLPGELRLYDSMTGRQLIGFLGRIRGETPGAEVDALAKKLDIDLNRPLTSLSSGMKRKVALLSVLVPRVPLIVLDEPTNTLDPRMRDELLEQLAMARERGQAVLFSSHVLQEVEAICDRVAILHRGQLVHMQDLESLKEVRAVSARFSGPPPALGPDGKPLPLHSVVDGKLDLEYRGPLPTLLAWLSALTITDLTIRPVGLGPIYRKFHG